MTIYLINASSNEVLRVFENALHWNVDFVEYLNNGNRAKVYCSNEEYFTDTLPQKLSEEEQPEYGE